MQDEAVSGAVKLESDVDEVVNQCVCQSKDCCMNECCAMVEIPVCRSFIDVVNYLTRK